MSPEEIKALRTRMGLEQVPFAALVGVTPFQISRWERGRQIPSPLALDKLRQVAASAKKLQKAS